MLCRLYMFAHNQLYLSYTEYTHIRQTSRIKLPVKEPTSYRHHLPLQLKSKNKNNKKHLFLVQLVINYCRESSSTKKSHKQTTTKITERDRKDESRFVLSRGFVHFFVVVILLSFLYFYFYFF